MKGKYDFEYEMFSYQHLLWPLKADTYIFLQEEVKSVTKEPIPSVDITGTHLKIQYGWRTEYGLMRQECWVQMQTERYPWLGDLKMDQSGFHQSNNLIFYDSAMNGK